MRLFPGIPKAAAALVGLVLIVGAPVLLKAADNSYDGMSRPVNDDAISLLKGDLETIKVFDLTRVALTRPEVADVVKYDKEQILILAKQSGLTTMFIWDKYGKRSIDIRVFDEDLNLVRARIQQLLAESDVKGLKTEISVLEGKLIVSGEYSSTKKDAVSKVLEPFGSSIINIAKERVEEDLVQIDAQIAELTASFSKSMGFEWTSALTYTETLPSFNPKTPTDFLKIGDFHRTTNIIAKVDALITEGKGRVLSKPKLVCKSGTSASFQVGGQIPISTTSTSSGGTVTENIQFKDYGVGLTVSPTIRDGKIDINLSLTVSDVDTGNSVGNTVAYTTRTAQTQLYLENSQTVVMAGLIKHNEGKTVKRIPILSDIPVLGAVFRHTSFSPNSDTELFITLTPTILKQISPADLAQEKNNIIQEASDESQMNELEPPEAAVSSKSFVSDGPMATKTMVPQEVVPYIRLIQQRIAERIAYPERARQYGWEGTVKLGLHILSDGTLAGASVKESSGYDLFDTDALNTAKSLAPYTAFPSDLNLRDLTVTVPIVYNLDKR
ncbi:MAG TPA: TonB family protein [Candidatus Omnitrophota bacterium]|nr:TonB family protein [Candidatus Omnitrophota bacterium]HPD84618.1 TonB family protein [Candidatus Omnitrophota bacterium]HRZ03476.1 TonB family protein [Candidatus Omnitrophota bacterium]